MYFNIGEKQSMQPGIRFSFLWGLTFIIASGIASEHVEIESIKFTALKRIFCPRQIYSTIFVQSISTAVQSEKVVSAYLKVNIYCLLAFQSRVALCGLGEDNITPRSISFTM